MQDKYLEDKGVIHLVHSLIPDFISRYKNGEISYKDRTLTIQGEVASQADKSAMEKLLIEQAGLIHFVNNTRVVEPPKPEPKMPISFDIKKEGSQLGLEGAFTNTDQISKLQNTLNENGAQYQNGTLKQDQNLEGGRIIALTQKLIPHFVAKYTKGTIAYHERKLVVRGTVSSMDDKNTMERLLAANAAGIVYQNDTEVIKPVVTPNKERKAFISELHDVLSIAQITFRTASARLTKEGAKSVKKVGEVLLRHPAIRVSIGGHTDSDGDDKANMRLSQSRVETVKKALEKQGVESTRMQAIGYGETQPIAPNDTAKNKAKNRRVEFKIIGE